MKNHCLENLEGYIFSGLFGQLLFVVWSVVCFHVGNSSDVTLAFEDAQAIQPFSGENTDNTDDTDKCRNVGLYECMNV